MRAVGASSTAANRFLTRLYAQGAAGLAMKLTATAAAAPPTVAFTADGALAPDSAGAGTGDRADGPDMALRGAKPRITRRGTTRLKSQGHQSGSADVLPARTSEDSPYSVSIPSAAESRCTESAHPQEGQVGTPDPG